MFRVRISSSRLIVCGAWAMVVAVAQVNAMGPALEDQVTTYLADRGFDELLEVQLFELLVHESDPERRVSIAMQLGELYLAELDREGLGEDSRGLILAKGRVLVGMMPADQMLELRAEILIQMYLEYEQAAELERIGLLDDDQRAKALEVMRIVTREMARISDLENIHVEQLIRSVARATDARVGEYEDSLSSARSLRSRANFFQGWSGYNAAVLADRPVGGEVFGAFGEVLGFEGKLPVLEQVDLDLLEYDHVARAMLGVGLSKSQNGDLSGARSWLASVKESDVAPDSAQDFANQRLLEVLLREQDWINSIRFAEEIQGTEDGDLLGVAQSRQLVIYPMNALSDSSGRFNRSKGGEEGAMEAARLGLRRLVELGEIEHVLDLQKRYSSLPVLESGFVGLYTRGLKALGDELYEEALGYLDQSLDAEDVDSFPVHSGDAVLRLALCSLKLDRYAKAVQVLEAYRPFIVNDDQQEESAWLRVLALDQAVRDDQVQMEESLKRSIEDYLQLYPLTDRSELLMVRYALTPYMEPDLAARALVIEDPKNPMAVRARRKLIGLLYSNPELVDDATAGGARVHEVIREHAEWVWEHESAEAEGLAELNERMSIVRIVLATGIWIDGADTDFLMRAVDRGKRMVEREASLSGSASELAYRRIQVLLLENEISRAGEIALEVGVLDDSVRENALLLVQEKAYKAFERRRLVPESQALVRYGRGAMEYSDAEGDQTLDRRYSVVAEQVASAADYLGSTLEDEAMSSYANALSLRVYQHGTPSFSGLVRTARLADRFGYQQESMECWLLVVEQGDTELLVWPEARYESLRLMKKLDPGRVGQVYGQFRLLYPEGLPEPWESDLRKLFENQDGGAP